MRPAISRSLALLVGGTLALSCGGLDPRPVPEYTSKGPASGSNNGNWGTLGTAVPTVASSAGEAANSGKTAGPVVPGGRVAEVKEADVYRIQNDKLFLLNTYRGFLVYDIHDTKNPVRVAHLPIYGYPVEMFVENNTVYALLSDALYLTQVGGKLQFERRNASQIATIDISDPAHPKLLQTQDLSGQLREGVSRKIDDTLYVVSYQPSGYWYYGWGPRNGQTPDESAWVYAFDASVPSQLKQVGQLQVFQGGRTDSYDPTTGESHSRWSNGVTLSATSNAIMVVQNWYTNDYVPPVTSGGTDKTMGCGSSKSDQESVVSIVDVSDPSGVIKPAATFRTAGALTDQFKQTYVYDAAANTGTYLGIFARNMWGGSGCNWTQSTQNMLMAWDIVGDGSSATLLSQVDFGKPNETVRGSYFDPDRKVVFAITARNMDPLYAISFADRKRLAILSAIDGLSGDMDLFRPVENGQYLLAVGRDNGAACASYVGGSAGTTSNNQIAVSLVDVRNLAAIRLVQRKCLDVTNAGWISSQVTWNLDQAHKMIGLQSDGKTSVLTVPISYSVQDGESGDWYWYRYETAVGIMSWDLARYDVALAPEQQTVISTHGRFVHPNGEVNRSVLFATGPDQHREMLNISDTHLSLANLQNLDAPALDAVVELASGDSAVYRFGDYVVQQSVLPGSDYAQSGYVFRVKRAGGELDATPAVASFTVGQVQQVMRHGNLLILFRNATKPGTDSFGNATTIYYNRVLVYDLSDPTHPKVGGAVDLPDDLSPYGSYYRYYCGPMGYYGGYYFGSYQSQAEVSDGLAFLVASGTSVPTLVDMGGGVKTTQYQWVPRYAMAFLDLRDPAHPAVSEQALAFQHGAVSDIDAATLVADGMAQNAFYLTYRVRLGSSVDADSQQTVYEYASYAQRWVRAPGAWQVDAAINLPGTLARTWADGSGERLFLTREDLYGLRQLDGGWQWYGNVSLNLLRQVAGLGGKLGAQRLDQRTFVDVSPRSLVFDGDRLYMTVAGSPYYMGYYAVGTGGAVSSGGAVADTGTVADTSDHLAIIDMAQGLLALTYDQPTGLSGLDLMGTSQNKLFVNLQGDGILLVDVANPAAPVAQSFYRTLGWASGIELAGSTAYVPAYYYGTYRLDLAASGNL